MNKLNVFNVYYCPWKYIGNWKENIDIFLRNFKWAYQRITRGFSDYDAWDLDSHMTELWCQSLLYLAEHTHGYPGTDEFPTYEAWQSYLYKIVELLRKSQEDYKCDEYVNKYEKNYDAITKVWGTRTPEEEEIVKKYLDEEARIDTARTNYRNQALDMIKHVYGHLWD